VAAGVLERRASVAGSLAGTARAPPAGLGPTSLARDASTCLPGALSRGACSRRALERWIAGATRSTCPKNAGIAPLRRLGHEEARRPAAGGDRPEEPHQGEGRPGHASGMTDSTCRMSVAASSNWSVSRG